MFLVRFLFVAMLLESRNLEKVVQNLKMVEDILDPQMHMLRDDILITKIIALSNLSKIYPGI